MKNLSLHTRIHYLKCKSFGLGFLYSITKNRLFFDKKIRTGIVLIAVMNMLAIGDNNAQNKKNTTDQAKTSIKNIDPIEYTKMNDSINIEELKRLTEPPISTINSNADTQKIYLTTCYEVEGMPVFPEGDINSYVAKNVVYPKKAYENGKQGRVIVQFIIDSTGNVIEPKVFRSVCEELDNEALRVVRQMPRWIPAKSRNKPITMPFTLPFNFILPKEKP